MCRRCRFSFTSGSRPKPSSKRSRDIASTEIRRRCSIYGATRSAQLPTKFSVPTGSVFIQMSDENLHYVRTVMDEVFGSKNFVSQITFKKLSGVESTNLASTSDFLLWYAVDLSRLKYRQLYTSKIGDDPEAERYDQVEMPDKTRRPMTAEERDNPNLLPHGSRRFQLDNLVGAEYRPDTTVEFSHEGKTFFPGIQSHWKTSIQGLRLLAKNRRLQATGGNSLRYVRFLDDFSARPIGNVWVDISGAIQSRSDPKIYAVQTSTSVVQRCMLMTTDPGDLVLDPTCGSGTTAYCAEQWGRRWITIDTSRVPLALARQRLLTATYPWYNLRDESRGPVSGFVYQRQQNKSGEEVGGIVPHVTLKSIANNEPPAEEVLVNRPEENSSITRITGPFCFEATIPTPLEFDEQKHGSTVVPCESAESFVGRMVEVLRKSPVLRLEGHKTVQLKNVRPPAKTLSLSAEAMVPNGAEKPVAFVFGPENGAVSEKLVYEAAREAHAKSYSHLYVIGFAIQPNARMLIDKSAQVVGIPATYVQATPDLMMGDLLKNMRSSQIFSVCGLPEIEVRKVKSKNGGPKQYEVELLGLDVFDPVEMVNHKSKGDDGPAWFLDTDYNDLCFHVSQAFFPRTGAWEALKKALRGEYEESVWDHLAGTVSAPFEAGEQGQIAVKVIDYRGNELLVVKSLKGAK